MATYDLEQQEQLDQVKHFWTQYGQLITWVLVAVLAAYAAWTGYGYWQQQRAQGAGGLYEELDHAASTGKVDKTLQAFGDLKAQYAGTTFAEQGALLAAKTAADAQKPEQAQAILQWLLEHGKNANLLAIGRLRLAGLQMDANQFDLALKTLGDKLPEAFAALADDRRGDIYLAQGKQDEAAKAFLSAWKAMDESVEYRHFIEGKLTALGQAPVPPITQVSPLAPAVSSTQGPAPGLAPAP